jgi:hypothetical protein
MVIKIFISFVLIFWNLFSVAQIRYFSSPLPLVFIDTKGRPIPDEPKILADMGIVWNGPGEMNHTSDSRSHYNGKIGIEIRGSSSQMFPKKSYGFETRNENGEDIDFPLLGLPAEEDWIFYGPYSDKSLIRNALTFSIAQPLGHYASRFRFVELFLNNQYQGVYMLMEKIKRDKVRVDIAKLNPDETEGEDLTGGYIIKIDKSTGSGGGGWRSEYRNSNGSTTYYQYEVPSDNAIVPEQKTYIQNYIKAFEDAVYHKKFEGTGSYRDYIDILSFVDFILISELTKNVDAYRLSTFLHKDKNGKLKAGPIWDFNLAYGNANYYDAWLTYGFQIEARLEGDNWGNPFWWKGLWADTAFVNLMKCRWQTLRKEQWATERILEVADSLVAVLGVATIRNFERWPVLGQYIWPNYYVASTHYDELNWMKNWIWNRAAWLDGSLPGICGGQMPPVEKEFTVTVYPNPVISEINLNVKSWSYRTLFFQLYNANGSLMYEQSIQVTAGEQNFAIPAHALPKGLYFYVISSGHNPFQKGKIVKF